MNRLLLAISILTIACTIVTILWYKLGKYLIRDINTPTTDYITDIVIDEKDTVRIVHKYSKGTKLVLEAMLINRNN